MELRPHEKIRLFRMRRGFTQQGLATKLNMSQMHVSRIERGISQPPEEVKRLIEQLLGIEIWERDMKAGCERHA